MFLRQLRGIIKMDGITPSGSVWRALFQSHAISEWESKYARFNYCCINYGAVEEISLINFSSSVFFRRVYVGWFACMQV